MPNFAVHQRVIKDMQENHLSAARISNIVQLPGFVQTLLRRIKLCRSSNEKGELARHQERRIGGRKQTKGNENGRVMK